MTTSWDGTKGWVTQAFQRKQRRGEGFKTHVSVAIGVASRVGEIKGKAHALPQWAGAGEPKPGRRRRVDNIRSLPMRAYLAIAALGESLELRKREEGQALVEYALLLALIAIVSIAVLTVLGTKVSHIFSKISTKL